MSEKIYLSGYTKRSNTGIHCVKLDRHEYISIDEIWSVNEENPTYICFSIDRKKMFSISSRDGGGVVYYKLDTDSDLEKYIEIDSVTGFGKAPCHIYFDDERSLLYSSNYHLGRLDIFKVENESIHLFKTFQYEMPISRCHMAILDPSNKFLIVVNLGMDEVYIYRVDEDFRLVGVNKCLNGMGPRHIVFSKDGSFAYLLGELDFHIDILSFDSANGEMLLIDRIKTVPDSFKGANSSSAIRLSNDGRFIYVSNRGYNSISVYAVLDDGGLEFVQSLMTRGRIPRDFNFNADGTLLIVGFQDDDYVDIYRVDRNSGKLVDNIEKSLDYSEIVCVVS